MPSGTLPLLKVGAGAGRPLCPPAFAVGVDAVVMAVALPLGVAGVLVEGGKNDASVEAVMFLTSLEVSDVAAVVSKDVADLALSALFVFACNKSRKLQME